MQIPVFSEKSWFDSRLRLSPEVASIDVPEEFFSRCIWSPNFIYTFLAEAKVLLLLLTFLLLLLLLLLRMLLLLLLLLSLLFLLLLCC